MLFIIVFWISLLVVVYHIFLYGLMLWFVNRIRRKTRLHNVSIDDKDLPSIAVVCAAYNEERHIEQKIRSFINLDYPHDKIRLIIISDDSTDRTNQIVESFSDKNVQLVIQKPRGGKQRALNLVEPDLHTEYVLSTDANSIFEPDSIRKLVFKMQSDKMIGLVSGELRLRKAGSLESGEGLYWKFESFLKQQDSNFYSIIGANGSIFLIRRDLFTQIDPASVDDFERTLYVLKQDYKAKYVSDAIVYEDVTEYVMEEFSRKVRIITQEWFALKRNLSLLNPFNNFKISLILFSHKLIRWLLFLFSFLILVSSMLINHPFYRFAFWVQVIFYTIGALELLVQKQGKKIPFANLAAYYLTMNLASLIAFIKFMQNRHVGIWNPVRKQG